jgi:hypothetical protein
MKRRTFLNTIGLAIMLSQLTDCTDIKYLWRKIRSRFATPASLPKNRTPAVLPEEGARISVEKSLNSRCMSDCDNDSALFHWGMVDTQNALTDQDVSRIVDDAHCRRFTAIRNGIKVDKNVLTHWIDAGVTGIDREHVLIENGMMQQTVTLLSAARGIAIIPYNMGAEGSSINDNELGTMRHRLEPAKASYCGSFWTALPPLKECPWIAGNLSEPIRDGKTPLSAAVAAAAIGQPGSKPIIAMNQLGQMLWACRGRTPHLYMSKPWGMTVPTALGVQDRTDILVSLPDGLYSYKNWKTGRPTHMIEKKAPLPGSLQDIVQDKFPGRNCFIIMRSLTHDMFSLLEIGYMLQNIMLQAVSLDVAVEATITIPEKLPVISAGIPKAIVAMTMA